MPAIAGAALLGRAVDVARSRHRVQRMEREQTLERERARIARDLHDEVGAGLAAISMNGTWLERRYEAQSDEEALRHIQNICRCSTELVRSVDELVWAVNPANDELEALVSFLTQYTEHTLDASGISIRFSFPVKIPYKMVEGKVRHALYLLVKEALNNVVKHARATTVQLDLPEKLISAVRELREGGIPMSRTIARKVVDYFMKEQQQSGHEESRNGDASAVAEDTVLSTRERQVLDLMVRGFSC